MALIPAGCRPRENKLSLLIGTYTDTGSRGIYTYAFNQETGKSKLQSVTEVPNPSFLTISPDRKTVYAVTEQQVDAAVSSFAFDAETGKLILKSRQFTNGRGTCHVTFAGKDVVATNYSSGSLTIFPVDGEGNLEKGHLLQFYGSGPDTVRQASSHIHSSLVSPDGNFLIVIDLGGDSILRFPMKNGKVSSFTPFEIRVPEGEGPRHFTFSRDGRFIYLLTELGGNILVYDYAGGDMRLIQTVEADSFHARGSADIHFSPDGEFLYASNRLQGDGLSVFHQDKATGLLTAVGYQGTAVHPRNFAITPNGLFVLVACRDSDVVQVFRRDPGTGLLHDIDQDIAVPHPVCVLPVNNQ